MCEKGGRAGGAELHFFSVCVRTFFLSGEKVMCVCVAQCDLVCCSIGAKVLIKKEARSMVLGANLTG